jgi:DNA-directed RNA polymerase specialized sigma24 family protein
VLPPQTSDPVVLPDVADSVLSTEKLEECIAKALNHSDIRWLKGKSTHDGTNQEDLAQVIRLEISQATERRGGMNAALAYTIARNQIFKFLRENEKEKGQLSLDDTKENNEGKEDEESYAASILNRRGSEGVRNANDLNDRNCFHDLKRALEEHGGMTALRKLVDTFYGTKRKIAEAILNNPDIGVCDIPGIPKSTVSRVLQVVKREFEVYLRARVPSDVIPEGPDTAYLKRIAGRFLEYLKDGGWTLRDVNALPPEKQEQLKDDFYALYHAETKEDTK